MSEPTSDLLPMGQRRCGARRRDGQQCGQPAMSGATVCRMHGGKAPQVQRAARLRLIDLIDPAIATLAREMTNQDARPGDRIKAAAEVLDRAGVPRNVEVSSEDARNLLEQRLLQMLADRRAEQTGSVVAGAILPAEQPGPAGSAQVATEIGAQNGVQRGSGSSTAPGSMHPDDTEEDT